MFEYERRVTFRDTDAGGIVHFSVLFTYFEDAEHAFWRSLGTSVVASGPEGTLTWPRVHASCDFLRPARFEDLLAIQIGIDRIGRSSLTFAGTIRHDGMLIANGRWVTVCCRVAPDGQLEPQPIPPRLLERLEVIGEDDSAAPSSADRSDE